MPCLVLTNAHFSESRNNSFYCLPGKWTPFRDYIDMAFDALILSKCFRLLQNAQCNKTNVYSNARKKILLLMWFFAHQNIVMLAEVTEVTHMQTIEINPQNWDSFSYSYQVCAFFNLMYLVLKFF